MPVTTSPLARPSNARTAACAVSFNCTGTLPWPPITITVYASSSPQGPFTLLGLREPCGTRSAGVFSMHCTFDLRSGGLSEARYLRVEDGEIYPCLSGDTVSGPKVLPEAIQSAPA